MLNINEIIDKPYIYIYNMKNKLIEEKKGICYLYLELRSRKNKLN